jgi:transposase
LYALRLEQLALLEAQSEAGHIDLYYGDESSVSESGYVPYGWQFKEERYEKIGIPATHGKHLNCYGLLSRQNELIFRTTQHNITAEFVLEQLEHLSFDIKTQTVVVLDNARIHTARKIKERLKYWEKRGLYIFYLPTYSPHLNIIERLWKELKARWLKPIDYQTADTLFYATNSILQQVGSQYKINFSKF